MSFITPELQILLNANRILASTLDVDELLKIVLTLAAEVVGAETGSLLLLDEKTNELVFNVALGEAGNKLKEIRLKVGEGIAGWVAEKRQAVIVNDPASDKRWTRRGDEKTKFVTRSILCVPLMLQGKLLGVVQAINKKKGDFSQEDQILLEAFAAQTAVAVQNARLFASLKNEKDKIETIFEQMLQGAVLTDESGQASLVNPSAQRLLGVESNSEPLMLWPKLAEFKITPPLADWQNNKAPLQRFEAVREGSSESDVSLFLAGVLKRLISEDDRVWGMLLFLRDVTAEKKEEKLKRNFLSLMSHKLKTPLVAITGYTPLLLEEEALMKGNPFLGKAVAAIHQQGLHLKSLVEKLIGFSLIEAEELKIERRDTALATLLQSIIGGMKTFLDTHKGQVQVDASIAQLPVLKIDSDKFKEVLKNLIENGIKFNRSPDRAVKISGTVEGQVCVLTVEDNGIGIPPHEWEKIFQKFYQVEESFTGQIEGAGLGLALVERIVSAHGGEVRVDSKAGLGSRFSVRLPLAGEKI
jgi:two-component system, NtrC family, sensor histidine kinase KinB